LLLNSISGKLRLPALNKSRANDGFSVVFAHCEVESLVVRGSLPDLTVIPGSVPCLLRSDSTDAKKNADTKNLRDFFYQGGLRSLGPLG
jgi:hypothetical protein